MTYRLVNGPEEVDLVLQGVNFSLQLHFVHVGRIYILWKISQNMFFIIEMYFKIFKVLNCFDNNKKKTFQYE